MTGTTSTPDVVVIGGGFFGAVIALHLARRPGIDSVTLIEREAKLLTRASYHNQARIHSGYHYPRSYTTAYRSRVNLPRFVRDWPDAVDRSFIKLYGVARLNSKVTARQFVRFCREIGAPVEPADTAVRGLFDKRTIEDVFLVQEFAFDASALARWAAEQLREAGVEVQLGTRVASLRRDGETIRVITEADSALAEIRARMVFNCTYSGLNQLAGDFPGTSTVLKHEITEMGLVEAPPSLRGLGITVMDGPFFSMMPFPPRRLHTLSHVRYTPHMQWVDRQDVDPHSKLASYPRYTRVGRMLRDVRRYLPAVEGAKHVDSLFEVKTVLVKNEGDDGRPILFERHTDLPGCWSVLGGKIDNIFDVLERLDNEEIPIISHHPVAAFSPTPL